MPTISLTHFVDFVSKAGAPKLTVVRNAKQQLAVGYDPATDFYKAFRDSVITLHKKNQPKEMIDVVMSGLTDKKKISAYPTLVRGYKKFLGKREFKWFDPPRENWSLAGLTVNVNPELGLHINGSPHIIKLYLKDERLNKLRVDIITLLMELVLPKRQKSIHFGVLDVRNAKLFCTDVGSQSLLPLLHGEAASFAQIFSTVQVKSKYKAVG